MFIINITKPTSSELIYYEVDTTLSDSKNKELLC
jgi:hypothetical protein